MKAIKNFGKIRYLQPVHCVMLFAVVLWFFSFRSFVLDKAPLQSDAVAYYEHFEYFLTNISHGVYPLWEPTRNIGVPMEFFLRRIGSYNPLYLFIIVINKAGLPYTLCYLFFLSGYYILGMAGFYLIAKHIFEKTEPAVLAFLLLMFSSLGTRLFDAYIIFMFVPMVWFFYFLLSFTRQTTRWAFLGMTFTIMLIATTYIPFYFLLIFLTFLLSFSIFYFPELKGVLSRYARFTRGNKVFVSICVALVLISLVPGCLLFLETGQGAKADIVLPKRHYDWEHTPQTAQNLLAVDIYNITKWSILEDILFSGVFGDLRHFRFAVLYIPVFAYIVFLLGAVTAVSRRLLVFSVWGGTIFLICSPNFPFYQFLYDHIFFFKIFRNLHYFLWVLLLPLFVLFVIEQINQGREEVVLPAGRKYALTAYALFVHLGLLFYVARHGGEIPTTYIVIGGSFLFFAAYLNGWFTQRQGLCLFCLAGLVLLQPLEVYHYLGRNYKAVPHIYRYNKSAAYLYFDFPQEQTAGQQLKEELLKKGDNIAFSEKKGTDIYLATKWVDYIYGNLNRKVLHKYLSASILVYDHVQWVEDKDIDIEQLGRAFLDNAEPAFAAAAQKPAQDDAETVADQEGEAMVVMRDSPSVRLLYYDVNSIKVRTKFSTKKFMVFNNSYHSGWRAFINGQQVPVYRANVAFKGVWVPPGENIVYMRFLSLSRYWFNVLLMVIFNVVFYVLVYLIIKDNRNRLAIGEKYV